MRQIEAALYEVRSLYFECSIHRRSASGLSVANEQITALTDAEAIAPGDARFRALIANRAGSATLRDDTGRIIWSARRLSFTGSGIAMAEADKSSDGRVVLPTVPIPNVNVPDPTTGSEPENKNPVKDAESSPNNSDRAADDGLA